MIVRPGAARPTSVDDLISPALSARLDRLQVRSRKVFAGKLVGERRSKMRGRSVEFDDYREYIPGDDIRFIDWNIYARLDRIFVKLFLEEQDMSVHIVLDASASMHAAPPDGPSKLLFAQRMAMALGYVGLVNQDRVAVSVFGGPTFERLPEMRGRRNIKRLGRFLLDRVDPTAAATGEGMSFTEAMRLVATTRQGKGVMIVLSDFLVREGYEHGLRYLAAGVGREAGAGDSFDTYCVQTLAPGEIDPTKEGSEREGGVIGDLRLVDVETGRPAEVTVTAALIKRYRQRLQEYVDALSSYCHARRMTHLLMPCDTNIETAIFQTLRGRGLVK